jgi:hypothetical protein
VPRGQLQDEQSHSLPCRETECRCHQGRKKTAKLIRTTVYQSTLLFYCNNLVGVVDVFQSFFLVDFAAAYFLT